MRCTRCEMYGEISKGIYPYPGKSLDEPGPRYCLGCIEKITRWCARREAMQEHWLANTIPVGWCGGTIKRIPFFRKEED